jgi:hypothetical protein
MTIAASQHYTHSYLRYRATRRTIVVSSFLLSHGKYRPAICSARWWEQGLRVDEQLGCTLVYALSNLHTLYSMTISKTRPALRIAMQ